MVTPVVDALPNAPDRGDGGAQFDIDATAWAAALSTWTTEVNLIGAFCGEQAAAALASALAGDLPPLTGHASEYIRVNAGETAAEFAALPSADVGVEGIAELATSADAINAVEATKIMTAYRTRQAIDAHPLAASAWVNFNQNGGVPIIKDSEGVASVAHLGSGVFRVTWLAAFSGATYACVATSDGSGGNTRYAYINNLSATYVDCGNGSSTGLTDFCLVAFGELA